MIYLSIRQVTVVPESDERMSNRAPITPAL